ncbi:MAG: MFS transporter [Chloroflexi bacterium]|nr:MFS transporter [Chloroflexota bacterium]
MRRLRYQIAFITLVRAVMNTQHRMIYPFITVFARGLGVEVSAITLALTARGLAGAAGPFLASVSDGRGRRAGMLFGLLLFFAAVSLAALWPTYPAFAVSLTLAAVGKFVYDPSMQAYLGDRVPYQRRGLVVAFNEVSWSLSFILGAPLMGWLIARYGWRSPFPIFVIVVVIAAGLLRWLLPGDGAASAERPRFWRGLGGLLRYPAARYALAVSLLVSAANEMVNLAFGVWMETSFAVQIAGLGAATVVIGLAELSGEGLTAALSDRFGKRRAVGIGLAANCLTALILPWLGGRGLGGALVGLFLFYLTFEFALVSTLPILTQIYPPARATMMATNIAAHSLGRAASALLVSAGLVQGILGSVLAAVAFNLLAFLALGMLGRTAAAD